MAIEELWSNAAAHQLKDLLAGARGTASAAVTLERVIAERLPAMADTSRAGAQLALVAADRLTSARLTAVARDLGVSERHLRRVFRDTVGLSPKAFAKLTRFHHALRIARITGPAHWARIAAEAGYYDQAHLIADFRAIAGVTPQALLVELSAPYTQPV